ncbi:hypothetical protein ACFQ07_32175 [Actinomadura adrarensis]|uniref:LppX_LprAFG lipoprotein n=1 Tax=Actinomadura adrarensis TaxID=1819600 RepID=A0ABW3CSK4_9ACTN
MAAGLTLGATGCMGLPSEDGARDAGNAIKLTAAQVLGKVSEKTGQTDAFQADLSMKMTGSSEGNMSMSGSMQYRTKPDVAYRMNISDITAAGQSMPGGMEQILVDKTMYMKMPMLQQLGGMPASKPWIRISLEELEKESGVNFDQLLEQSRQMDPIVNTKMLTASKDVREVGKETVDGVQTTHYSGTYRMQDAIAQLPADQQQAYREAIAESGMESMKFDLWVDDQQLPRQMTMKSDQTAAGAMTMTMKFKDFGKAVQITAPPAGQVTDLKDMMGRMPTS